MEDIIGLVILGGCTFLLAGTIKGTVGLGLPTTAIGLMTLFIAPRQAIVLTLMPMLLTNAWQVWRMGEIGPALRRYAPFGLMLAFGVGTTVSLSADAPDRLLYAVIGTVIVLFAVINLTVTVPALPARWDTAAQVIGGGIAGLMGGLAAVWAPPMAIYLSARQVDKDEFVRATGLLIFVGCLPLVWGYAKGPHMTWPLALISVGMVVPTMIGFALGERIRARLDQQKFRKVFLLSFLVLGVNLIRRAIWV